MNDLSHDERREWLETDGLGGFAMGTASGIRSRRYHGLLCPAMRPPAERTMLLAGLEVWAHLGGQSHALDTHRYGGDVLHPDGSARLLSFAHEPWPHWTYVLPGGVHVQRSVVVPHARAAVCVAFRASAPLTLRIRPLLASRDFHGLQRENASVRSHVALRRGRIVMRLYEGSPEIAITGRADYEPDAAWFRNFLYAEERARGLDASEDLFSPGQLTLSLDGSDEDEVLVFSVPELDGGISRDPAPPAEVGAALLTRERERRAAFPTPLHRAAAGYVVRRGKGHTIIAGYPWFGDWGRDTFIALRGICHAAGDLDVAESILREWAGVVSEGMLPNRFPDRGETPEYNSVDASLWYCVAVTEHLERRPDTPAREALLAAVSAIVRGYAAGTRFGIRADDDALLACGVPGQQLTWMDAKVGDWVVTPRIGKPVEIQALWIAALSLAARHDPEASRLRDRAIASFADRFPDPLTGGLADVVDVDHVPGTVDRSVRPNQILAAGGLPVRLVEGEDARRVVDLVEHTLLTPLGLRSLDPAHPAYCAHYEGGVLERDGSYHQGTVWPWLMGPFVDAWVRVRGSSEEAKREARERFLPALEAHLEDAGLGHVSEITDADAPFTPRGCPFQAWSVGELLRVFALR